MGFSRKSQSTPPLFEDNNFRGVEFRKIQEVVRILMEFQWVEEKILGNSMGLVKFLIQLQEKKRERPNKTTKLKKLINSVRVFKYRHQRQSKKTFIAQNNNHLSKLFTWLCLYYKLSFSFSNNWKSNLTIEC